MHKIMTRGEFDQIRHQAIHFSRITPVRPEDDKGSASDDKVALRVNP